MEATTEMIDKAEHLARTAYEGGKLMEEFVNKDRWGQARTVVIDEKASVVYKLVLDEKHEDNHKEWKIWAEMPIEAKLVTAESLYLSLCGKVLVMELATIILDQVAQGKAAQIIRKEFDAYLTLCLRKQWSAEAVADMLSDNHNQNMGYRADGSPVWIDYAGF